MELILMQKKIDISQWFKLVIWKYFKFLRPKYLQVDGRIVFDKFSQIKIVGNSVIKVFGDFDLCSSVIELHSSSIDSGKLTLFNTQLMLQNTQLHLGEKSQIINAQLALKNTVLKAAENFRLHGVNLTAHDIVFFASAYFLGQSVGKQELNWSLEKGNFEAGKNCRIQSNIYQLASNLKFGSNTFVNAGTQISCLAEIIVGDYVMISYDCLIFDNNSHSTNYTERRLEVDRGFPNGTRPDKQNKPINAPIYIKDDVWIGARSVILKGITIHNKSIVAAHTIVTSNVGEKVIVYGNPNKYKPIK
jgi:acetyltransferase-like isoleucine patch superfamily enzyme